jgi:uracil-DNA glycosylase family 4
MTSLARPRVTARRLVTSCTKCVLRDGCKAPIPAEHPKGKVASFVALGDVPGPNDDRLGRPFVGPPGRTFRNLLERAGIDPFGVTYMNVVACAGSKVGVGELGACREHVLRGVETSGASHILLVGAVATSIWRGDLKLQEVHGGVFAWLDQYTVMPIHHPASLKHDPGLRHSIEQDLDTWAWIVREEGLTAELCARYECVVCGEDLYLHDPDLVPYCTRHWGRKGGQWDRERKRWTKVESDGRKMAQEGLW